jgi:DHA1 family bicyclomycin/chloramphenicol resistance-like MFS transporter
LAFAAMFCYISGSSFVLQEGYGVSPTVYSVLFGVNACGLIALSQANGALLDRVWPRLLLVTAMAAQTAAGVAVLAASVAGQLAGILAGYFVLVSTIGMITPNATALALDRHPERAGTAAALMGGVQSVIAAAAAPVTGLIGEPGHGVPMGIVIVAASATGLLALVSLARDPSSAGRHRVSAARRPR